MVVVVVVVVVVRIRIVLIIIINHTYNRLCVCVCHLAEVASDLVGLSGSEEEARCLLLVRNKEYYNYMGLSQNHGPLLVMSYITAPT